MSRITTSTCGAFLLTLGLLSGCGEKFLEETPTDQVTDANFYKTATDAIQATNAIYSELGKGGQYNYALWGIGDIGSDLSSTGGGGGGDGIEQQQLDNFNIPSTNPLTTRLWGGCYIGIGRANIVLQKVPAMQIDPAIQTRCIGEAEFLRAKYYFDLVRAYGDVPLLTKPPQTLDEVNVPRTAQAQVYALIEADLLDAISKLPVSYSGEDIGRATKWAAAALLAKVYLTEGKLAEAAQQARTVINSSGKSLWPNYADNFKVSTENGQESLFEVQYISGRNQYIFDGLGFVGNEFFGPRGQGIVPQGGYGFNIPEADFVAGYENGDTRRDVTIWKPGDVYPDGRTQPAFLPGSPNGYGVKKWFVGKINTNIWDSELNIPVLRLAEVYLILAEAAGPNAEGLEAINKVRRRAFGLPIGTASARDIAAGISATAFKTAVWRERKYELAFENDRWFDMKRTGELLTSPQLIAKGVKPFNVLLPIPQAERDVNPGLSQNPGY
ncbi:RagB/SusD family nutrient uptake outer membrane protein [Microvirga sp. STR05]|uniref:RagB/SusD family nutrient uptake outer membrane protein n=1 Tax=Hymenobacter duratus TaxID=2771356 RepID=A0ABR8JLU1_9BACT|nr:RagB/SusD family nutrient uptake outer membrane protein [Hymenobacter duratus]MBD2716365.1 RagB/SusD family nutrient uptake outer membrane protein [Hymenobacter duratus]MBR7951280.1 RagB/SusD family nutrient uptake outer membrane protein [Microvirga sp. STR05]